MKAPGTRLRIILGGLMGVALGLWLLFSETRAMSERLALSDSGLRSTMSLGIVGVWWIILFASGIISLRDWCLGNRPRRVVVWLIVGGWIVSILMPLASRLWEDLGIDERLVGILISAGTSLPLGLLLLLASILDWMRPPTKSRS